MFLKEGSQGALSNHKKKLPTFTMDDTSLTLGRTRKAPKVFLIFFS